MFGSIKYNLSHLAVFRGRDGRQTFWYYVLFLAIVEFVAGFAIGLPLMIGIFRDISAAAQAGVTDPQAMNGMIIGHMANWMQSFIPASIGLKSVMILLFVAAFVRRIHDSGKTGWWAALPIVTRLTTMWLSYSALGKMQQLMANAMQHPGVRFQFHREMALGSLAGWIGYIVVVVFGIMKPTQGPNRYGETPVEF